MSVFQLHYRLTVYAERSSANRDESVVLSPAANAPHSDTFKVTTLAGLAGWQPYLFPPRGRRSSIDPLTKKVSVGALTFKLADFRTTAGGSNASRWVTAFVGDITGRTRLLGLKVYVEESIDNGASWNPFYVGRVTDFTLDGALAFQLEVNEGNENLKVNVFDGFMSSSVANYANYQQLLPIGLPIGYGPVTASSALYGSPGLIGSNSVYPFPYRQFFLTSASVNDTYNILTQELANRIRVSPLDPAAQPAAYNETSTRIMAFSGSVSASFQPFAMGIANTDANYRNSVKVVVFRELTSSEPLYYPLASMSSGSVWRFSIISVSEPTKDNPLVINNVHPATFLKDILEGSYSRTAKFYVHSGSLTTLLNDNRFPQTRWIIDKKQPMNDFIEKSLCQAFSMGYRTEAQLVAGVPQAVFVPFSMLLPTSSAGLSTITSADVVASSVGKWTPTAPLNYLDSTWYEDSILPIASYQVFGRNGFVDPPDSPTSQITSAPFTSASIYVNDLSLGQKNFSLDLAGLRFVDGEYRNGVSGETYTAQHANQLMRNYAVQFTRSPATVELSCLRTSNTNGCQLGDWRLVDVDVLPNATTHLRGGARLMQCIERSEMGLTVSLKFIDSAQNVISTGPIFNAFTTSSINPKYALTGSFAIPSSCSLQVQYAVTPTNSGSQPNTTSSLWMTAFNDGVPSGTFALALNYLPAGSRVWMIARTQRIYGSDLTLPSLWASSSTGFVDTQVQTPPTMSYTNITPTTVDVSWSGSASPITLSEVYVASPSGSDSLDLIARVPPGSTRYTLSGLTGSFNPHLIGVRYADPYGGYSTTSTITVSLSGSLAQWPTPPAFVVLSVGSNLQ